MLAGKIDPLSEKETTQTLGILNLVHLWMLVIHHLNMYGIYFRTKERCYICLMGSLRLGTFVQFKRCSVRSNAPINQNDMDLESPLGKKSLGE